MPNGSAHPVAASSVPPPPYTAAAAAAGPSAPRQGPPHGFGKWCVKSGNILDLILIENCHFLVQVKVVDLIEIGIKIQEVELMEAILNHTLNIVFDEVLGLKLSQSIKSFLIFCMHSGILNPKKDFLYFQLTN